MEVGLRSDMPTYSGGLGVLAGDSLKAAADAGVPAVGVSLLHRQGYFRQRLDAQGNQFESPFAWNPEDFLTRLGTRAKIELEGTTVHLAAWLYEIQGVRGHILPVVFLDTKLSENSEWHQSITNNLYGGDLRYRLCQETVLGYGGIAMLRALGQDRIQAFHMNEGHSALLALALLEEQGAAGADGAYPPSAIDAVRRQCVFTTHTPVPAGHDQFPISMVTSVLGQNRTAALQAIGCCPGGTLNMTFHALFMSHYINGVSMRHEEISRGMFPGYPVNSVTNGIHAVTWTSPAFQDLYDAHIPQWRTDNHYLRYAVGIPLDQVRAAHTRSKRWLLDEVARRTGEELQPGVFTLGFARRATGYKRADLLFHDLDRLKRIAHEAGKFQVVFSGKAHPRDEGGKAMIRKIFEAARNLSDTIRVVYVPEYDMDFGAHICSGVDLWLNTPLKPEEASGTSGMKAAMNGVPSLSVLDGWWVEGCVEGVTGWSVGEDSSMPSDADRDSHSLYDKLEYLIIPTFYDRPMEYTRVMRWSIAINGSYYNAERMLDQYVENAYSLPLFPVPTESSAP